MVFEVFWVTEFKITLKLFLKHYFLNTRPPTIEVEVQLFCKIKVHF